MQPAKPRYKNKTIQERKAKIIRHINKTGLPNHIRVILNPSNKTQKLKNQEQKFFCVNKQTKIAALQSMLKQSFNCPLLAKQSMFLFVKNQYLNVNQQIGEVYNKYAQTGDFLIIEYQETAPY